MAQALLQDQFIDPLNDFQLQVYVKQTRPPDLQQTLSCALELESASTCK